MVHLRALPGTPGAMLPIDEIVATAAAEARTLAEAGFDALIIENMHDRPYIHGRHGPETVAVMARAALAVRAAAPKLVMGVQVLSGGNREAMAVALAAGGAFIRCENFVFSHVADEGLLALAEAGDLLRYRRQIGAERIAVFADVKKKHASHAITADVPIGDAAEGAEFFGADGVVVTGTSTGKPVHQEDLLAVARATDLPLLVGSGVSPEGATTLLEHADGLIVGSWIKEDGHWANPLDPSRCRGMANAVRRARA